jgi:hypothetical protein
MVAAGADSGSAARINDDAASDRYLEYERLIKSPDGGIVVLDVGQKTEDLVTAPSEDYLVPGSVGQHASAVAFDHVGDEVADEAASGGIRR